MKKYIVYLFITICGLTFGSCVKDCTCIEITDITDQTTAAINHRHDTLTVTQNTRGDCALLSDSTVYYLDSAMVVTITKCE